MYAACDFQDSSTRKTEDAELEFIPPENLEAEEEVKAMRKLILAAKCHAIREAQILEKSHIRQVQ